MDFLRKLVDRNRHASPRAEGAPRVANAAGSRPDPLLDAAGIVDLGGAETAAPLDREQRTRAWWRTAGPRAKKCDICSRTVQPGAGLLYDSPEVARSHDYITHIAQAQIRQASPGADPIVVRSMLPAAEFMMIGVVKDVKTPWLVCAACAQRYFE